MFCWSHTGRIQSVASLQAQCKSSVQVRHPRVGVMRAASTSPLQKHTGGNNAMPRAGMEGGFPFRGGSPEFIDIVFLFCFPPFFPLPPLQKKKRWFVAGRSVELKVRSISYVCWGRQSRVRETETRMLNLLCEPFQEAVAEWPVRRQENGLASPNEERMDRTASFDSRGMQHKSRVQMGHGRVPCCRLR